MNRRCTLSLLGVVLLLGGGCLPLCTPSAFAQDRVRAKVGVQVRSGPRTAAAKNTDIVKPGDELRIYVVPEADAYLYIIHNDGKKLTLLNATEAATKRPKGMQVVLPSAEKFYRVDGDSPTEALTVICSPTELREVSTLAQNPKASQQSWLILERTLIEKSTITLGQTSEAPLQMAGNVRSMKFDPFVDSLPVSSGNTMLVKKYAFQVQK